MLLLTDKTYCRPTKVDESGRFENWDRETRDICREWAMPRYLFPPVPGETQGIQWYWPGKIPQNRAMVIEGPPGAGKTFLASFFATKATQGFTGPDGQDPVAAGTVLYYCRERDMNDAVAPHLLAMQANVSRVTFRCDVEKFTKHETHYGQRPYAFPHDLNMLEHDLRTTTDAKLVIIDSLRTFAPTTRLMRESLAILDDLSAKYRVPIVVLIQTPVRFDKDGKLKKEQRPWDDAAKYVWCLAPDPFADHLIRFEHKRSTFSKESRGVEMRIQEDGTLHFDVLRPRLTRMERAMAWLRERLKNGSIYSEQILAEGKEYGYSSSLLYRAKDQLGILSDRRSTPDGGYGRWWWTMPDLPSVVPDRLTHLYHDNPKMVDTMEKLRNNVMPVSDYEIYNERADMWDREAKAKRDAERQAQGKLPPQGDEKSRKRKKRRGRPDAEGERSRHAPAPKENPARPATSATGKPGAGPNGGPSAGVTGAAESQSQGAATDAVNTRVASPAQGPVAAMDAAAGTPESVESASAARGTPGQTRESVAAPAAEPAAEDMEEVEGLGKLEAPEIDEMRLIEKVQKTVKGPEDAFTKDELEWINIKMCEYLEGGRQALLRERARYQHDRFADEDDEDDDDDEDYDDDFDWLEQAMYDKVLDHLYRKAHARVRARSRSRN